MTRPAIIALAIVASAAAWAESPVEEMAAPIVKACVDKDGKLVSSEIVESSGYPEIDAAALKVAQAAKFSPGTGKHRPRKGNPSCVKFVVKFVIRDGEPALADPPPT